MSVSLHKTANHINTLDNVSKKMKLTNGRKQNSRKQVQNSFINPEISRYQSN